MIVLLCVCPYTARRILTFSPADSLKFNQQTVFFFFWGARQSALDMQRNSLSLNGCQGKIINI